MAIAREWEGAEKMVRGKSCGFGGLYSQLRVVEFHQGMQEGRILWRGNKPSLGIPAVCRLSEHWEVDDSGEVVRSRDNERISITKIKSVVPPSLFPFNMGLTPPERAG